jgi:hypothetical protein
VVLHLDPNLDVNLMRLYIEYADSDPLSVTRDGTMNPDGTWEYVYTPPAGDGYGDYDYFRLWRTNAASRKPEVVSAAPGTGGDYVASGVYAASNFMIEDNTITLWAEGVLPIIDSDIVITMTAGKEYLDATTPISKTDVVDITVVEVDIDTTDYDRLTAVGDYVYISLYSSVMASRDLEGWGLFLTIPPEMDVFVDAQGNVPLDETTGPPISYPGTGTDSNPDIYKWTPEEFLSASLYVRPNSLGEKTVTWELRDPGDTTVDKAELAIIAVLDLDMDSDNTGTVDRTVAEDVREKDDPIWLTASDSEFVELALNYDAVLASSNYEGWRLVLTVPPKMDVYADAKGNKRPIHMTDPPLWAAAV